jgi:hypothetical protein
MALPWMFMMMMMMMMMISIEGSPPREPQQSFSASQEIFHTSWKQKIHWCFRKRSPTAPVQRQSNSVHVHPFSSFKIHFSFMLPSSPSVFEVASCCPVFQPKHCMHLSPTRCVKCNPPIPFEHSNNTWRGAQIMKFLIMLYTSYCNELPVKSSALHSQSHRSIFFP